MEGCVLQERPSTLYTLFCALELSDDSYKTCLEPKPKENGGRGLSYKETNKVGPQHDRREAITVPRSPFILGASILVGPVNHEGDQFSSLPASPLDF